MSTWERWAFNILSVAVFLTGVIYFWMEYLLEQDDPFSVINHPLQPLVLNVHILAAPLLLLVFGIIYKPHVLKKLNSRASENRRSGWIVLLACLPMAVSGYLLQILLDPLLLQVSLVIHLVSGTFFGVTCLIHLAIGLRLRRIPSSQRGNTRIAA